MVVMKDSLWFAVVREFVVDGCKRMTVGEKCLSTNKSLSDWVKYNHDKSVIQKPNTI